MKRLASPFLILAMVCAMDSAIAETINFDQDKVGAPPAGWIAAVSYTHLTLPTKRIV